MDTLQEMINQSNRIVFFGGAGVSTESGIPDFRGTDGLYHQKYDYPPETIISHHFFIKNPKEFYRFYKDKMIYLSAKPNAAHLKLAEMERKGKLDCVITQNIDGLHQASGSQKVLELHGSVLRNYCMKCHRFYPVKAVIETPDIPFCSCGGMIKPDVVLYEESLDSKTLMDSVEAVKKADMLIVGGTSLNVYPAASLIDYYSGSRLVLINKTATPYDRRADLMIQDSIGKILGNITIE